MRRAFLLTFALTILLSAAAVAAEPTLEQLCAPARSGEQCGPGNGRRTAGGGDKVSHKGWPAVTGILWQVTDAGDHRKAGGPDSDELLGHHGDDDLRGGD